MSVRQSGTTAGSGIIVEPSQSPDIEHTDAGHPADTIQRSPRSRRNALFVILAVIAVIAGVWWFAGREPAKGGGSSGRGRPATTVGVAKVTRADVPLTLSAIGTVQPVVAATVRAQIAGVLQSIRFTEGQAVTKGQLLAQVDPRPSQQALLQAQGTLAKDQALLNSARVDLVRYQTLLGQDSIARQQVDTQAALVKQYAGTLAADRAAVNAAALNGGYTRVTSPVSGRAGLRQADVGNYVTPGDATGIVIITVDSPIDVSFAIPQSDLAKVQMAARAGGGLAATALDQNGQTVIAQGRFLTLDNVVDTTTGTVKGKARFDNGAGTLFPNQFVNVRLLIGMANQAIVVPVSAVRHGPNGDFVFTLVQGNVARLVKVTSGASDGARTVITAGLNGNETVITDGADKIDDGSKVVLAGAQHGAGAHGGKGRGGGGGKRAHGTAP